MFLYKVIANDFYDWSLYFFNEKYFFFIFCFIFFVVMF